MGHDAYLEEQLYYQIWAEYNQLHIPRPTFTLGVAHVVELEQIRGSFENTREGKGAGNPLL